MQIVLASQGTAPASQSQLATQQWPPRPDAPSGARLPEIVAPAGGVAPSDLAALCGGMGGGPMARHMGDGAMHRRVVEGGQLPVRRELLRRRLPAPGGPLAAGGRPLVTTTGPAGGQVHRQGTAGHSAERGCLARLVVLAAASPFSAEEVAHMTDVVLIAAWFMLREIELGSALVRDLCVTATHVTIDVPLHKTAPGGECVMTRRRLECACGVQVQPLCPFDKHFEYVHVP